MSITTCPICHKKMVKNGKTSAGKQRWICKDCLITKTNKINNDAKTLITFLTWLLSKQRQVDMPGKGRTFRRKTQKFWSV